MNNLYLLLWAWLICITQGHNLLIVNGAVTSSSARILVDRSSSSDSAEIAWELFKFTTSGRSDLTNTEPLASSVQSGVFDIAMKPYILHLDALQSCHNYRVEFQKIDANQANLSEHRMTSKFSTLCTNGQAAKVVVVSCDRHADDLNDDDFVATLNDLDFDLALHIGDQIYADKLQNQDWQSQDELEEAYRNLYREGWTRPAMASFLRRGSHIMIPDDHDALNAVSPTNIQRPELVPFFLAGQRTIYEYQTALMRDVDTANLSASHFGVEQPAPVHTLFTMAGVGFAALDARFFQSYGPVEEGFELLGQAQTDSLLTNLAQWQTDPSIHHVVVLTSVPLLWPSEPMAHVAALAEGDKYPMHPYMRSNLIKIMTALQNCHRLKPVTAISGDVHLSSANQLCYSHNAITQDCIPAYVTSGLTSSSAAVNIFKLLAFDAWVKWPLPPQFSHLVQINDKVVREQWYVEVEGLELINNYLTLEWNDSSVIKVQRHLRQWESTTVRAYHDIILNTLPLATIVLVVLLISACCSCCASKLNRH
eukprot:m.292135 g.292135  ORF g.292135 m.292135 type:complete len:536 (+) comp17823_c0_seq1:3433-5040(+)